MGQINVSADGALSTYPGNDPTVLGVYLHPIFDVAAVTTAQNFYALYNPVGSGRTLTVVSVTANNYNVASVPSAPSMIVSRINASPTGGTLVSGASLQKFVTGTSNSVAQVYTGGFTATANGNLIGFPPTVGSGAQASNSAATTPGASFVLAQGEGVMWAVPAGGNANQRWNIQMIWVER